MQVETTPPDREEAAVLYQWSARRLQPIILVYVGGVFLAMMAFSHFLAHSPTAVKALALGAIGFIGPLVPGVLGKTEYRLTEAGLQTRPLNTKAPKDYKEVFLWPQLSHVVPMKYGFKYYKPVGDSSWLGRFWKNHVSDAYSGEFHIEVADRDVVLGIMVRQGIPTSRP